MTADETRRSGISSARALRLVAWLSFGLLGALYVWAGLSTWAGATVVRVIAFQIPVGLSVAGSVLAWRRSESGAPERAFWGYLALATAILFASEGYFGAYQVFVDPHGPISPSPFDVLNVVAAVAFMLLLASVTRLRLSEFKDRARSWVAMYAIFALLYAVVYRWLAAPAADAAGLGHVTAALWALHALFGIIILTGMFVLLVGYRVYRWSEWERLIAISIGAYGLVLLSWVVVPVARQDPTDLPVVVEGLAYLAGYHLLFMGSVYRLTGDSPRWMPSVVADSEWSAPFRSGWVAGFTLAAVPLLAWMLERASDPFDRGVYMAATGVATAAIVARTALFDWESRDLRRDETIDRLTSLLNRTAFAFRLDESIAEAAALSEPLSLAVLDVDDFARFNVMHGRETGDRALVAATRAITARAAGLGQRVHSFARLGGDEFAVLMPAASKERAVAIMAELLSAAHAAAEEATGRPVFFSAGVSTFPEDAAETTELLNLADAALYWAKYRGKNRIAPYDGEVTRALTVETRIRDLAERSRLDIVRALAAATDARDTATSYHSRQVAVLVAMVCEAIGIDPERAREIELAALLHDVGKVGVPDSVLHKRAWLSTGERAVLAEHAGLGARILETTELAHMAPWVRAHHERWDGAGYPDGLAGEEIPFEARIIGVCNAYDQMVSGSPEKGPLSQAAALQEIDHGMATAFDPEVAEVLIDVVGKSRALSLTEVWPV